MTNPESKIEGIIQSFLVNSENDKQFISDLKKISASAVELENLDLFGDQAIGQKVAMIKEDLENKRPYERNLNDLKMYIKSVSGGKKNFSETEVHNMLDKEMNMVSEENVNKINEKVMNMEGTLDKVESKLDNLVEQQKSILKNVDPESAKTTDEKVDDVKSDVKTLAAAFSDLCDYVGTLQPQNFAQMPVAAPAAPATPAAGADPTAMATQALLAAGFQPGTPEFDAAMQGWLIANGIPVNAGTATTPQAMGQAPAPAPAPQGFSETPVITYSEVHDAFLSDNGDIYTYSADTDSYVNQDGERLCYSEDSNIFYSEEPKAEPKYVATLYSANGDKKALFATDTQMFSETGDTIVYNKDANAFFSASGDMLFDAKTFSQMGGFLQLVEADPNGNAIFFSTETKDYYFYSAEADKLFSEEEIEEINDADDEDDADEDEDEGEDDGDETDVIHVDGSDGNKIIVIDNDNDLDTKVEGDKVVITDDDGFDELEVTDCDEEGMSCHSELTKTDYRYSFKDHAFSIVDNSKVSNDVDNRSPEAITTFSFVDNMINDTSDPVQRYEALTSYLTSKDVFN